MTEASSTPPRSLLLALVGEVGELAELFGGIPATEAVDRFATAEWTRRVGEEVADVLAHLLRLADALGVDVASATRAQPADSHRRFVADAVRGTAPEKRWPVRRARQRWRTRRSRRTGG